ncbi:hypothetical protein SLOPH_1042 [Spraguea lophii 42_110]|uniref:Cyclic nucleotide-binding domain-containing protein n=1 Tax=Spraguea lophii (strain 42_110) TaxID=1358809 RepID=S7XI66_SPRLO|nr:hypothetical protein SLOPH_1042 [Spraguea lophii 42_110]
MLFLYIIYIGSICIFKINTTLEKYVERDKYREMFGEINIISLNSSFGRLKKIYNSFNEIEKSYNKYLREIIGFTSIIELMNKDKNGFSQKIGRCEDNKCDKTHRNRNTIVKSYNTCEKIVKSVNTVHKDYSKNISESSEYKTIKNMDVNNKSITKTETKYIGSNSISQESSMKKENNSEEEWNDNKNYNNHSSAMNKSNWKDNSENEKTRTKKIPNKKNLLDDETKKSDNGGMTFFIILSIMGIIGICILLFCILGNPLRLLNLLHYYFC